MEKTISNGGRGGKWRKRGEKDRIYDKKKKNVNKKRKGLGNE